MTDDPNTLDAWTQAQAQASAPVDGVPTPESAPVQCEVPAELPQAIETQAVEAHHSEDGSVLGLGGMTFDGSMVLLTWIAFLIAAVLLGKFLWKPILRFLEERETEIKTSLEDAAKARKAAAEADEKAAQTIADAEQAARAKADALAGAARQHVADLEAEAREAIAARRKVAEADLEVERQATLRKLSEQAGGEIAYALDKMLPGLLTPEQKKAYQEQIAASVQFR